MFAEIAWPLLKKYWQTLAIGLILILIYAKGHHDGEVAQEATTAKVQAQFDQFVSQTAELGKKAQAEAKAKDEENQRNKEKADNDYQTNLAALRADNQRLLDENSHLNYVSAPPISPRNPQGLACYESAELERTLQQFTGATADLLAEGDEAALKLRTAQEWATSLP